MAALEDVTMAELLDDAQSYESAEIMSRTIDRALFRLSNMTTDEFSKGGDGMLREELANALGYASYEEWLENQL